MNKNKDAVESAKNLINTGKATCVVVKDGALINIESGSGIKPVLAMYDAGLLKDAVLVDKVVGRATAMIAADGGVCECYGMTVSRSAYDFLTEHGIPTQYEAMPDYIINRLGTDMCPMEKAVMGIDDTALAISAIRATVKKLSEAK